AGGGGGRRVRRVADPCRHAVAGAGGPDRRGPRPDDAVPPRVPHVPRDGTDVRERVSARRIALFGGVYGNRPALEAALADARAKDAEAVYFLGDVGGFGPHPDAAARLLRDARVTCIQGNYDAAIAAGADDCGCGYSDPRDVRFAHIAYVYTLGHSSSEHRRWLGSLPPLGRITLGDWRLLLCHGSP